jgi:hypothetical protein
VVLCFDAGEQAEGAPRLTTRAEFCGSHHAQAFYCKNSPLTVDRCECVDAGCINSSTECLRVCI